LGVWRHHQIHRASARVKKERREGEREGERDRIQRIENGSAGSIAVCKHRRPLIAAVCSETKTPDMLLANVEVALQTSAACSLLHMRVPHTHSPTHTHTHTYTHPRQHRQGPPSKRCFNVSPSSHLRARARCSGGRAGCGRADACVCVRARVRACVRACASASRSSRSRIVLSLSFLSLREFGATHLAVCSRACDEYVDQ
jgi:hypothetical protein